MKRKLLALLTMLLLVFSVLTGALCEAEQPLVAPTEILVEDGVIVTEEYIVEYGYDYSTPIEVALYLYVFEELPPNFITKNEAQDLGWVSSKGNLWDVCYGLSIGGDYFGNREGLLPKEQGRKWTECDVNYYGGYRGSERILFSTDGLIYYTNDHYQTFTELYDGWYVPEETEETEDAA